jgi:hypothetical protein
MKTNDPPAGQTGGSGSEKQINGVDAAATCHPGLRKSRRKYNPDFAQLITREEFREARYRRGGNLWR